MSLAQSLIPGGVRRLARLLPAALGLAAMVAASRPAPLAAEELPAKFREAVDLFLAGDYKGCQIAFGRAAAEAPRAGLAARAAYGAACCAAVRNDVDGGFEALSLALANGFIDLERALTDPRLDTLRADSRWLHYVTLTQERQQAHQKTLDPDLLRLYLERQTELVSAGSNLSAAHLEGESETRTATYLARASARREEAWKLVESGRAKRPDDAFHAAALLVESDRPAEVERAAALARQALAGNPDLLAARPLVATAVDRAQMLAGKPQKYGTQLVEEAGKWQVYDVDPAVTDAERAEWGLPPLAEARARAGELNRPAPPANPPASPAAPQNEP